MKIAKSVNRLGTEAVYSIFAKTKKLVKQGKKIIDLSLGQSDFKSPKHAVDATIQALKDGHHGYTLPNGIIECRETVSRKIKSLYNANIDPERIVIMPGGKPTMHYAISFFGEPGAEIIYPDPGFPIYESMINFTGAKAVPYNMTENKDFSINPDKILSLINEKTRLLILNNPHNPTGSFTEKKFKPKCIIDLATLTGAIIVALGEEYAGLFSNNNDLSSKIEKAGEKVGEKVWRLPLHENYDKLMNSPVADIQNINYAGGAGSITAAQFLQRFILNKTPWAHLDIAGMAFSKKAANLNPGGATGFGVRLLNKFIEENYE